MTQQTRGGPHNPQRSDIRKKESLPTDINTSHHSVDVSRVVLFGGVINRLPIGKLKSKWGILGGAGLIISLSLLILFSAKQTLSNNENDFYRHRLATLKESSEQIRAHVSIHPEEASQADKVQSYTDNMLSASLACQEMRSHAGTHNVEVTESFSNSVQQVNLFCDDLEDITDYARKVSRATQQLLTYDTNPIATNDSLQPLQDTHDILGFTRTDISKLTTHPTQDPATEEMLAMIDTSLQVSSTTLANPSEVNRQALIDNLHKLQNNLGTAKQYFWKNTVKIDAMLRSISRLYGLFQED